MGRRPYPGIAVLIAAMLLLAGLTAGCGSGDGGIEEATDEALQSVDSLINLDYGIAVTRLTYPYVSADNIRAPEAGQQYVLVTVTVRNTGESPVVAAYTDFRLEASDGERYGPLTVTGLEDDFGAARSPIPGSEEIGSLLFEIPEDSVPVALWENVGIEAARVELPPASA